MFIKNCWYVAGWGKEVPMDGFLARTIINIPLAIWRDGAGSIVAFEDRCCHRGAPLSMGVREGDCVRCMYHGLLYDKNGFCIQAPAQERIPPRARVKTFRTVEKNKWIWIWMGSPELADESLIPDTRWLDHPDWRSVEGGYLHYECDYLLIADNLLDFSHLPFLHPSTLGGSPDYASVLPKVEKLERGVRLTKLVLNTQPPAYSAKYSGYESHSKVDRWMFYDFLVPGILLMDSGMGLSQSGVAEGRRENTVAFRGCQALTPETDKTTHYFFAHPHNFLLDQPAVTQEIQDGVITAFEEDRAMIMAQQKNLLMDENFKMVPFSVDSALSQFRWVVQRLLNEDQLNESAV
jgi:phenylpropionate dioxygenase-like ring-hydroxylating dioxygenase large terminal subunit